MLAHCKSKNIPNLNFASSFLFNHKRYFMLKVICCALILTFSFDACSQDVKSIHEFTVETIDGHLISLSQFKGKKILIVNTASKCGLTPQYEQLEQVYQRFKDSNFVIIGFPANNFLSQEPGSNEEIESFCQKNYGVSFPMMSKISVKGKDQHALYAYLTKKELNGYSDNEVKWNFQKYLIDEDGKLVGVIDPKVKPDDDKIISWIQGR
jgi:glutathione peroxidase